MANCPISDRECNTACPWSDNGVCVLHTISYKLGFIAVFLEKLTEIPFGGGAKH